MTSKASFLIFKREILMPAPWSLCRNYNLMYARCLVVTYSFIWILFWVRNTVKTLTLLSHLVDACVRLWGHGLHFFIWLCMASRLPVSPLTAQKFSQWLHLKHWFKFWVPFLSYTSYRLPALPGPRRDVLAVPGSLGWEEMKGWYRAQPETTLTKWDWSQ